MLSVSSVVRTKLLRMLIARKTKAFVVAAHAKIDACLAAQVPVQVIESAKGPAASVVDAPRAICSLVLRR